VGQEGAEEKKNLHKRNGEIFQDVCKTVHRTCTVGRKSSSEIPTKSGRGSEGQNEVGARRAARKEETTVHQGTVLVVESKSHG